MSFKEWAVIRLEDLCSKVTSGGTPNTQKQEYYGGNVPWLKTQEITFNRIYKTETFITEEGLNNSSAKWIPENSVIVAMYGATAGRIAINKIPLTTNQACCNLILNPSKANYNFIYYHLLSRFEEIAGMAIGGAQPNLNAGMIKDLRVQIPPIETQNKIAEILSSIDDKIENNLATNQTLEEIARTLFKEWFVNFNYPNADGNLKQSEYGDIPERWEIGKLGDVLEIKYGKDHKHLEEGIVPVYGSGGIMRYVDKPLYERESILIPRKGTLSNLFYVNTPFWSVDTMFYTRINLPKSGKYLFHLLQTLNLASMNVGTAVPSLTTDILNNIVIPIPPNEVLSSFDSIATSIFDKIHDNLEENKILSTTRDSLLPQLMSGKIKI